MRRFAPLLLASVFVSLPTLVHADEVPGAKAVTAAATPEVAAAPAVKKTSPAPVAPALPFRLGLFYTHAFGQSGNLTRFITQNDGNGGALPSPAALGIDLGVGLGSYVRYHFAVGTEWEGQTGYAARGFRFDPITLGFPILVWSNSDVAIHVEPLLHLVRGEILFQSKPMVSDSSLFRIESGIAGAVTVVTHHWFVSVEPLSVDFRVFEANNKWVHTGFSHLWWFQLAAGREF